MIIRSFKNKCSFLHLRRRIVLVGNAVSTVIHQMKSIRKRTARKSPISDTPHVLCVFITKKPK